MRSASMRVPDCAPKTADADEVGDMDEVRHGDHARGHVGVVTQSVAGLDPQVRNRDGAVVRRRHARGKEL